MDIVFVAQLVEQLTLNQWVQGSSPCEDTTPKKSLSVWDDNNTIKAIWFPCKNQPLFLVSPLYKQHLPYAKHLISKHILANNFRTNNRNIAVGVRQRLLQRDDISYRNTLYYAYKQTLCHT